MRHNLAQVYTQYLDYERVRKRCLWFGNIKNFSESYLFISCCVENNLKLQHTKWKVDEGWHLPHIALTCMRWGSTAIYEKCFFEWMDEFEVRLDCDSTGALVVRNIARIAKAAIHKLPGKSILHICPVCPVCPQTWLLSRPWWPS